MATEEKLMFFIFVVLIYIIIILPPEKSLVMIIGICGFAFIKMTDKKKSDYTIPTINQSPIIAKYEEPMWDNSSLIYSMMEPQYTFNDFLHKDHKQDYSLDNALNRRHINMSLNNKTALNNVNRVTKDDYEKYFTNELQYHENREWWNNDHWMGDTPWK